MQKCFRFVIVIVVCHVATPLYSQTIPNTRRAFADVPLAADWDDAYSDNTRVPGATWSAGAAFGVDSGKSGVELDVGVPQWHVKNRPPQRYQYVGPSYGYAQQGHFYESSSTERRRSIDVTVLHRLNVPLNRRASFTWLIGGGFVYRPDESTSVTNEVLPDGRLTEVNSYRTTSSRNYLAAVTRVDVELKVAPAVSIVPRLRLAAFPALLDDSGFAPRMFVARPEIALRWRF